MPTCCQMFLERIRGEYVEMPDLKLTNWQACRLWNIEAPLCDEILAALVEEGFLWRTASGAYVSRDSGRRGPLRGTEPDASLRRRDPKLLGGLAPAGS